MTIEKANEKPSVIFLLGPTASGKTELAFALAEVLPLEIISVDSTQVYRGLDIGSAKPSAAELTAVPHHLIDIRDPRETYSAAEFRCDALVAIEDILSRDKIPLLVGGSMLYFNVLLTGLADLPPADESIRAEIAREAEQKGWPRMHQILADVDPETAARLHPNHSQRIGRALEVFRATGQSLSAHHQAQREKSPGSLEDDYQICQLAFAPKQRRHLHQRISQRFDQMVAQGFEEEVRQLRQRGDLDSSFPALRAVGYRQMWAYLDGEFGDGEKGFAEMVEKAKAATRQLAKRQFTWLRGWDGLRWLSTDNGLATNNGLSAENEEHQAIKIKQIRDQALNSFKKGTI